MRNRLCDEANGRELLRALYYMPLTTSQLAAYQSKPTAEYGSWNLDDFSISDENPINLSHRDSEDFRRRDSATNSIITTRLLRGTYRSTTFVARDLELLACWLE